MKYSMKQVKQNQKFVPFQITLTFETEDEYVDFHDHVMFIISKSKIHKFHGDVYRMGHNRISEAEGEI